MSAAVAVAAVTCRSMLSAPGESIKPTPHAARAARAPGRRGPSLLVRPSWSVAVGAAAKHGVISSFDGGLAAQESAREIEQGVMAHRGPCRRVVAAAAGFDTRIDALAQ
jgi:hypothetical protein